MDVEELKQLRAIKEEVDRRMDLPHHLGYFMEGPMTLCQPHPDMSMGESVVPVITPDKYVDGLKDFNLY